MMNLMNAVRARELGVRTTVDHDRRYRRRRLQSPRLNMDTILSRLTLSAEYSCIENQALQGPIFACHLKEASNHLAVCDEVGNVAIIHTQSVLMSRVPGGSSSHGYLDTYPELIGDVPRLRVVDNFVAHDNAIFDLKWRSQAAGESQLLTASGDTSIALWDLNARDRSLPLMSFKNAHKSTVKSISLTGESSPSFSYAACLPSNLILSGGRDGEIKLWDLRCPPIQGHISHLADPHPVHSLLASTAKRRRRASHSQDSELVSRSNPSKVVSCVLFDHARPDYFFSSGVTDGTVKMWDIRRMTPAATNATTTNSKRTAAARDNPLVTEFPNPQDTNLRGYSHLVQSHDGRTLYANCADRHIYAIPLSWSRSFSSSSAATSHCGSQMATPGKRKMSSSSAMASHGADGRNVIKAFYGDNFRVNNFTRIALLGEDHLASGSPDGLLTVWSLRDPEEKISKPLSSVRDTTGPAVPSAMAPPTTPTKRPMPLSDRSSHLNALANSPRRSPRKHLGSVHADTVTPRMSGSGSGSLEGDRTTPTAQRSPLVSPFTLAAKKKTPKGQPTASPLVAPSGINSARARPVAHSPAATPSRPVVKIVPALFQLHMLAEISCLAVDTRRLAIFACTEEPDIVRWSLPPDIPTLAGRNAYSRQMDLSD